MPGKRLHHGFLAQDVKRAADAAGVDFGGHVMEDPADPDSVQGLRDTQLIALVKAVQERSAEVDALRARLTA